METQISQVAHSQGEWKTWISDKEAFIVASIPSDDDKADITVAIAKMEIEYMAIGEREANARLIASAPAMLQTLQECLDVYENKEKNGGGLAMYETCLKLVIENTIKKATNP